MAPLTAPHWEAVTPKTREMLAIMGQLPLLQPFYLAGGTALALRLGHRISQHLDLFAHIETLDNELRRNAVAELSQGHAVQILEDSELGLELHVDGLPVSLFGYGYPLLAPTDLVSGVQVAGLLDIGLMKLDAVAGRGTRRDFLDLYFITQQIALDELFARGPAKYPTWRGYAMRVLAALVDFEIADRQDQPTMLQPVGWDHVKAFFQDQARRLGQAWFAPDREG